MPCYGTAISVLRTIASVLGCSIYKIEDRLEDINKAAGHPPRPFVRKHLDEERLDAIRAYLGTPEGAGVIEQAERFVRLNQAQ